MAVSLSSAIHVQNHSPVNTRNWTSFEEDFNLFPAQFSNALYYESFQDGVLWEEVEEDDDEGENLSFSSCLLEENFSTKEEDLLCKVQQSPLRSFSEVICGSNDDIGSTESALMNPLPDREPVDDDQPLLEQTSPRKEKVEDITKERNVSSRKRKAREVCWKNLSQREKQEMVEELLVTIGCTLGPRERLEVARILDTDGDISDVSYVLSIDPENLSEEKVVQIQSLLEEANREAGSSKCRRDMTQGRSSTGRDSTSNRSPRKQKNQKRGSNQSNLRKNLTRFNPEKQSKECRQNTKEKRSGLFEQEEVISLYCDGSSDEEVNILE